MKKSIKLLTLLICTMNILAAQFTEKNDRQSIPQVSSTPNFLSQASAIKIVQDGPVDSKEYIVGPGDIFSANIWTSNPLSFQIPVTPEGTVIIPTIAEIRITGMTLDSAKRIVMREMSKKILTGSVSFTLMTPRSFVVSVYGAVENEGPVVVQSTQRIDAAIILANSPQKSKSNLDENERSVKSKNLINKPDATRRNILVRRKNGSEVTADLEKYFATNNSLYNPLLLDGDVIIVQPQQSKNAHVGIYGAVSKEGNYEFVEGDSLSTLINIAGGLSASASEKSILYRMLKDGSQNQIEFNPRNILSGDRHDILLQMGDKVIVRATEQTESGGSVMIEGEVKLPGTYPIIRNTTTLSELVTMAGGITSYAALPSSKIYRISPSNRDGLDSVRLKRGLTTTENYNYILQEITINKYGSIVQADFVGIFEEGDSTKDVILQNGDKIIIATGSSSVYVFGEVTTPGYVPYQRGKDITYYINLAGGLTNSALESDIKIIKASTKQWLNPDETVIEDGDYVWVPKDSYRTFSYYLTVYSQVFSIVGTVISLFILSSR